MKIEDSQLIVISAPSGTGKSTLIRCLLEKFPHHLDFSISTTTRPPRESEVEGKDYFFVSPEDFQQKIESQAFLEYAYVNQYAYGTSKEHVARIVANHKYCILDIDVQGALQVFQQYPRVIKIFILPPSLIELRKRLEGRGDTTASDIHLRMQNAKKELQFISEYDYYLINHHIEETVKDLEKIIFSSHIPLRD